MIDVTEIGPGDVLCTRSEKGLGSFLIRLGAALRNRPNLHNHVVIVHHRDAAGTWWGIEGRPGGVGWVDMAHYLKSDWTLGNIDQPKTSKQRTEIVNVAKSLLGTPYDWTGIALDAMEAISAQELWAGHWGKGDTPPAHVVCSSLADWIYDHIGLASPGAFKDRTISPGDWAEFIIREGWDWDEE